MASSDFNLQTINSKEMADNFRATIQFGGNIFVCGRRGSSKTMQAKQAVKDSKAKEVYLNLSLTERVDLGGYPNFFAAQSGEKYINFLMPHFYKDLIEGDEPCVAILDEVDKCSTDIFAPLLEFTQFRSINGFKLKNLQAIIMTGNLQAEGGQRPSLPLLDRAEKFLIEMNPDHWLDWAAISREIHPSVAAYIADNRDDLQGEIDPGELFADASPRGWHNASKLLFFGEKHKWHPQMMKHKVSACVGKKAGIKYSSFFEHYQILLPTVERIMAGEKIPEFGKFEKTKQLVVCMIACSRLAALLDSYWDKLSEKQQIPGAVKLFGEDKAINNNISKFMARVDSEMALISFRSQIGLTRVINAALLKDPAWDGILDNMIKKLNG